MSIGCDIPHVLRTELILKWVLFELLRHFPFSNLLKPLHVLRCVMCEQVWGASGFFPLFLICYPFPPLIHSFFLFYPFTFLLCLVPDVLFTCWYLCLLLLLVLFMLFMSLVKEIWVRFLIGPLFFNCKILWPHLSPVSFNIHNHPKPSSIRVGTATVWSHEVVYNHHSKQ